MEAHSVEWKRWLNHGEHRVLRVQYERDENPPTSIWPTDLIPDTDSDLVRNGFKVTGHGPLGGGQGLVYVRNEPGSDVYHVPMMHIDITVGSFDELVERITPALQVANGVLELQDYHAAEVSL